MGLTKLNRPRCRSYQQMSRDLKMMLDIAAILRRSAHSCHLDLISRYLRDEEELEAALQTGTCSGRVLSISEVVNYFYGLKISQFWNRSHHEATTTHWSGHPDTINRVRIIHSKPRQQKA